MGSVNDVWELDVVEIGELACSGGAVFGRKMCLGSEGLGGVSFCRRFREGFREDSRDGCRRRLSRGPWEKIAEKNLDQFSKRVQNFF